MKNAGTGNICTKNMALVSTAYGTDKLEAYSAA